MRGGWLLPQAVRGRVHALWGAATAASSARQVLWLQSQPLDGRAVHAPWVIAQRADAGARAVQPAGADQSTGVLVFAPWLLSRSAAYGVGGNGNAIPARAAIQRIFPWGIARHGAGHSWLPWGMGVRISHGVIIITPPPDPDEPGGTAAVPVLEFYYVINTVSLMRADTGEPIPCRDLRIGISRDTPHWAWSASIPGSVRARLARDPDPIELLAMLNGQAIRLVVERTQRDRRLASDWIRASGRSRSAWLSDPYSGSEIRGNSAPATAQQLAVDALTINGVSIGWGLDWQVPDWLVPAGVWSHSGTYMEAVARIAEAAGGYVQAHATDEILRVLPHYPVVPWSLSGATPSIVLPEDVVEVEGVELFDSPSYNAVFVAGQSAGRLDRVVRAGSAGDRMAGQVVDALATDPAMTAARGAAVLASGGLQERVQLRLPVLSYTGLILPGNIVDYTAEGVTRRGYSRSLDVEWSSPDLWQTIEVEVHV